MTAPPPNPNTCEQVRKAGRALGLSSQVIRRAEDSGLAHALARLWTAIADSPILRKHFLDVAAELSNLPVSSHIRAAWPGCGASTDVLADFLTEFSQFFIAWHTMIPSPDRAEGDELYWIQRIDILLCGLPSARTLLAASAHAEGTDCTTAVADFLKTFNSARAAFLDSPASTATIADWIENPRTEIVDFEKKEAHQYISWNDFFERRLNLQPGSGVDANHPPSPRPVAHPEREWLVSAPTDCIVQPLLQIQSYGGRSLTCAVTEGLALETLLDVKGEAIQLAPLLGSLAADIKMRFAGGAGYSCILLPNGYHHFHAPVSGQVVHTEVIEASSYGLSDLSGLPESSGQIKEGALEIGQFARFSRAIIVIEVARSPHIPSDGADFTASGFVASIAVGLNTVGSVTIDEKLHTHLWVERGKTRLGHFSYGGSLNLLLFSRGLLQPGVQVRLGAQIGKMA